MSDSSLPVIYQLKVLLLGISPMIWRRLLVKSDSAIADLHYILQIAMGWEDIHLHHFIIRSMLEDGDWAEHREELSELSPWLLVHQNRFDRQQVNRRLQQYASGDKTSMLFEQTIG